MSDCCKTPDQLSIVATNTGSTDKTFRMFGGSTNLPSVDDNTETNVNDIELVAGSNEIGEQVATGTLNPLTGDVFYSITDSGNVIVIDANGSLVSNIVVGSSSRTPSYDSIHKRMYVPCTGADEVHVIDVNPDSGTYLTVIAVITVGSSPRAAGAFDANSLNYYIPNRSDNNLSVVDTTTNTETTTIPLGSRPEYCAIDTINKNLYVCNGNAATVSIVDIDPDSASYLTVIHTSIVGTTPTYPIFNVTLGVMYISNMGSSSISTINCSSFSVSSLSIGTSVFKPLLYNDETLFVSDFTNSKVLLINCVSSQISQITGTSKALGGSIDTVNNLLFIPGSSGSGAGYIYIIDIESELIIKTFELGIGNSNSYPIFNPESELTFSLYDPVNTAAAIISTLNYSIIPVTIVVNSGANTLPEINNNAISNPMCICKLKLDVESKGAFNNPIEKNRWQNTGSIMDTDISILQKFTATQRINTVELLRHDFKTCVLDGENYLQWVVPAMESVTITLDYCELNRADEIDYPFKKKRQNSKRKYYHGSFKYTVN